MHLSIVKKSDVNNSGQKIQIYHCAYNILLMAHVFHFQEMKEYKCF